MMTEEDEEIVAESDDYLEVCVGVCQWRNSDGKFILEEDFAGCGEIWRVHKSDPDPFPSKPQQPSSTGDGRHLVDSLTKSSLSAS
jgi:hypothetical protein